jgi:hypothetical protein
MSDYSIVSPIFYYNVSPWNYKDCEMNQMWIQQITDKECDNQYVAIAYNPRSNCSMTASSPRNSYSETLDWVRKWCGSFSNLY